MAVADEIKTKFSFDITEFKNNISAMNTGIRIAKDNFTAAAGALGDWKESQEGVSAKMKSLSDIMELQKAKVAALTKEYDDLKSSGTASQGAMQKLQAQIAKAAAELGKTEGEFKDAEKAQEKFGDATEDTTAELKKFADKTDDAGKKTNKFVDRLKNAGSVMKSGVLAGAKAVGASMAAIGTAALAGIAGMAKLTQKALENADAIQKQSDVTGLSAERVQELSYIAATAGVDFDTLSNAQGKLTKSMASVGTAGGKKAEEAFARLGISARDASGQLRDAQTVMAEAFAKLKGVSNETERDALAMQLFGKSAMELNPLIKLTADEMANLTDEARKTGAVLSNEQIAAMDAAGDSIDSLKKSAMGLGSSLVVAMLPAINEAIASMKDLAGGVMEAVKTGDWSNVGKMISDMLVSGIQKISNALPGIINTVTTMLNTLINVVVPLIPTFLPLLFNAATQLLQGLLTAISANLQPLMDMAVTMLMTFVDFILQNLPLVIDMGLKMIIALALGIAQALPTLVPQIIDTVLAIVNILIANLPMLINAGIMIILALIQGLIGARAQIMEALPVIVEAIVTAIVQALPLLIDAAVQIVVALIQGLIEQLPLLVEASIRIVGALVGGIIQAAPQLALAGLNLVRSLFDSFVNMDWIGIGTNIIKGIADGLGKAGKFLADAARKAASGALDAIKNFLGIASPSKVMRDQIGVNMGLGVAEGLASTTADVSGAMKAVTKDLTSDVTVNGNVNVKGNAESTAVPSAAALLQITNFYNNTDKDIETLAYQFEAARQRAAAALGG